jgi:nucleotide-binding universal stress UspA family protein
MSETGARQPREDGAEPEAEPAPERPFTDILCAVDGTRGSLAAVEQAAVLAGPHGHLTLLAVTAVTGAGAYRSAAISPPRAEHIMERAVEIAERLEVPCTAAIDPAGPPPRVILERAAEHELLALGAPSASWLGGELLDGVAHAALDSLKGPVLACRTLLAGGLGFAERILVASDGLDGSDRLVELAGELARAHGASVILLHATDKDSPARSHRVEEQARRLEASLDRAGEVRLETGGAAEAIVQAAREAESSLVVMGSRGLSGLRALGSVSRRVVHGAHCSVLLMPPECLRE